MSKDSQTTTGVPAVASEPHTLTPDQAAAALNEHGFLLQQAVREQIASAAGRLDLGVRWELQGYEYPVQAQDNSETNIDLLLKGGPTYLCLECKRPNAGYKHWLFFDSTPFNSVSGHTWVEASVNNYDGRSRKRRIERMAASDAPTFQHFLEVTLSRATQAGKSKNKPEPGSTDKASRSDTLHAAFRQAVTASSGLVSKIMGSENLARAFPVIVTTAQLYGCHYPPDKIDPQTGTVPAAHVQLKQHPFVAVHYSAPESLALKEDMTPHERSPAIGDLMNCILRTVYVVRVHNINEFLHWASQHLV